MSILFHESILSFRFSKENIYGDLPGLAESEKVATGIGQYEGGYYASTVSVPGLLSADRVSLSPVTVETAERVTPAILSGPTVTLNAVGSTVIAFDLVGADSMGLNSFSVVPDVSTWSPGDWFGVGSYGAWPQSAGVPFALADDSATNISGGGVFTGDNVGIIDGTIASDARFFGSVDTVNSANPSGSATATWEFDITGFENLSLSIDFAAMGDFEASGDSYVWSYAINGGTFQDVFVSSVNENGSQTYTMEDGDMVNLADPMLMNGTTLSDTFQTLTEMLTGTGSTLTLRLVGTSDGGSEGFVARNIVVMGDAVSTTPVINEFQPNPNGSDPANQTIELKGTAGEAFTGWIISLEADTQGGTVDRATEISGTFDANGLLAVDIPDLENPSFTLVLSSEFNGMIGDQIDADLDGNADDAGAVFGTVFDAIGIPDTTGDEANLFGAALGGTDFAFTGDEPRLIFRDGSNGDLYAVNDPDNGEVFDVNGNSLNPAAFDTDPTAGTDTFGAINPSFVGISGPTERKIHEIQGVTNLADGTLVGVSGAADESPLLGEYSRIQGVVTMVLADLGGFYVQEEDLDADGDVFTSEGIFVFSSDTVNIGDLVTVDGTVAEVEGETRLNADSVTVDAMGVALPTATAISFPTATVLQTADGDYVANLEMYEGMLVTIAEAMSVTELFQLDRFGTIRLSSEGRLEQFTQNNTPDAAGYEQFLMDIAARTILIDDGQDGQNPDPILVPDLGSDGVLDAGDVFRMGDQYTGLTGVLSFSEDEQSSSEEPEYRLHNPTGTLTQTNPRPATPDDVGGSFKVASLNVLNFFTTLDEFPSVGEGSGPNGLPPRGADANPQDAEPGFSPTDEFDRQLSKLVEAIIGMDADVIGLVELENDFLTGGSAPTGSGTVIGSGVAIDVLVDAINAALGSTVFDWVRPSTGEFIGTDAIAVGFIYNTLTTNLVGASAVLATQAFLDPNNTGLDRNRPALAQTFEEIATGESFTAVINHFKSKGDSGLTANDPFNPDSDQLDGQGFWNDTRTKAAQELADWLATDPTGSGDPDVLILGDLNAYQEEDPIRALEADGYTDLADNFLGSDSYGYVFDGQTGTLDYALANSDLLSQVAGVTQWHINADEADAFDYNLEFGRDPGLFTQNADTNQADNPFRASDHDPVIIGLDLATANTAPVANDDIFMVDEDNVLSGNVQINDVDLEGDAISLLAVDTQNGVLVLNHDGSFTYTPYANFTGTDSFVYVLRDPDYPDTLQDAATVSITVNPVNDAPIAVNDTATTTKDMAVVISVLANDVDVDMGDIISVSAFDITGTIGLVTDNGDGTFTYDANGQFDDLATGETAMDSFTYTISDLDGETSMATVTVTIEGVDDDPMDLMGTPDPDTLIGGNAGDTINGKGNDDLLLGNAGNDTIFGAGGMDTAEGGAGNDEINGGYGDDHILGQDGDDSLLGDLGEDVIEGGDGNDTARGGREDDTVLGGAGNDLLLGNNGFDLLNGGDGNDQLYGGFGEDILIGGLGNDFLSGDDLNDSLEGGAGDDTLEGGNDRDTLRGGDGNDLLKGNNGRDLLAGDAGDDDLRGGLGNDELFGGDGNDLLNGGDNNDTLTGGGGFDSLAGGNGRDVLMGGADDDELLGEGGNDMLFGEDGDDFLNGGNADDVIDGGAGNDMLYGGLGDDTIIAGEGNDTMMGGDGDTIYTFSGAFGNDVIGDFIAGVGLDNVIELIGFGPDFDTFFEVMSVAVDNGTDTTITLGTDLTITLLGVVKADLHADDFDFIQPQPLIAAASTDLQPETTVPDEATGLVSEHGEFAPEYLVTMLDLIDPDLPNAV